MTAGAIQFRILGTIEVVVDGRAVTVGGAKLRTLLAVLLIAEGRPLSGQQMIRELWGEQPPPTAAAALQVYLSGLRKFLGEHLRRIDGGYVLEISDAELDATQFARLIVDARVQLTLRPVDAVAAITAALALWRGEPMSGAGEAPLVMAARARLEEQRLVAIEERAKARLGLGQHDEVVSELVAVVTAHPTREHLAGHLMTALYRCGRQSDAAQTYARLEAALSEQLGVQPSEEVAALASAIKRHDPTISAPSRLPIPATRFVGRRQELDRLEALLGSSRILTLVGAGGSGKTRLALQLARDIGAAEHPEGVHFVELAGTQDGASVLTRIAGELDIRERPGEALTDSVLARLRTARVLLVLDNCEHLTPAVRAVASVLIEGCSALRILATSRESLGLAGEQLVPVGGLAVPNLGEPYETAVRTDALRLLSARGAEARNGFCVDASNIDSAVAVCRKLDGLPLAIELAAARLRVLSLHEIEERLDHQLKLPANVSRAAEDRHATIRATIDWSYELLDSDERVLFRRLGAFVNGCTLDAAEHVCADPDADPALSEATVLDTVARLVDRSMLVADHSTDSTRFRMLETIHQYANDRLAESDDSDSVRCRHSGWYRKLIEAAPAFGGDEHLMWMQRFSTELDNFRAAMDWAMTRDPVHEDALAIATPLWWYWWASGQMREGKGWLLRALAATEGAGDDLPAEAQPSVAQRGPALRAAAALARNSGELEEARALGERALAAHQQLGDLKGLAMAWNNLCMTATGQRDYDAALVYAGHTRSQAEAIGDLRGLAVAANNTGIILRCTGRLDEAQDGFTEALERFRSVGDVRGEAAALGNLGILARQRGDIDLARRMALDSLRHYRELNLVEGELDAIEALAGVAVLENRPAAALRLLLLAERERRTLGAPTFVADENDDRDAALEAARAALDQAALAQVAAETGTLRLAAAVDELLL